MISPGFKPRAIKKNRNRFGVPIAIGIAQQEAKILPDGRQV
jgi:hypothetical protein